MAMTSPCPKCGEQISVSPGARQKSRNEPGSLHPTIEGTGEGTLSITTLEGEHLVSWGDWIIQGIAGEIYPCKPEIFHATYDPIPS